MFLSVDASVSLMQILTLGIVSSSCSIIGVFLFYRRSAMMANAISHSVLLAIVGTFFLQQKISEFFYSQKTSHHLEGVPSLSLEWALIASLLMACLTYYTVHILGSRFSIPKQASTGIALSAYFSLGIVFITIYGRNSHIGIETIMGNIDAVSTCDLKNNIAVLLITIVTLSLSYKELISTTFDPSFSHSIGISNHWIELQLMALTSCVVVTSFKAIGYILVLAFIVGIPLCCRMLLVQQAKISTMIALCIALSWALATASVAISYLLYLYADLPVSTGGLCVSLLLLLTLIPQKSRAPSVPT